MTTVLKNGNTYPFSKGILDRSLRGTGLSQEKIYDVIDRIMTDLNNLEINEIDSERLMEMVCNILHQQRYYQEERSYRVSRRINKINKPVVVLISGALGTGTNSIAAEVARHLGIGRAFNSDVVRDVMRYMLPADIVPALHTSSFEAGRKTMNPVDKDSLINGFVHQSSLVCEGVRSYINQNIDERVNSVINGEHLIPGYLNMNNSDNKALIFHYVLHLENADKHKQQFQYDTGGRYDPDYYLNNFDAIRKIQKFFKDSAVKNGVKIIENYDFDHTVKTILDDIIISLETDAILSIHKPSTQNHYKSSSSIEEILV